MLGLFEVKLNKSSRDQETASIYSGMGDMLFSHLQPNIASVNHFYS